MTVITQVRMLSGRRIAYPRYNFLKLNRQSPVEHDTNLKYAMRQFLGPRNYKGEYPLNRYAKPATNHTPKYIQPDLERGRSLRDPVTEEVLEPKTYLDSQGREQVKFEPVATREGNKSRSGFTHQERWIQPFPENKFCFTNYWVDSNLKRQIFKELSVEGASTQDVSHKYGLKVARVEAVVKLYQLEEKWSKRKNKNPDVAKMASTMEDMFPLFNPPEGAMNRRENLSEIPIPPKAQRSRFVTLAESEPFGPLDAASVLELEPAVKTLERLATEGEHSANQSKLSHSSTKGRRVVYGAVLAGERSQFKVVDMPGHQSAYRYGSGNRDNKKDRRIAFNEHGRMIYA
ncbi:small ribosomal subunit protein mS45 [Monosporozyma unispora]|nr:hypothetical protein C6P44_000492 [Kazachstania unispora]